jgi:hypothetical protein
LLAYLKPRPRPPHPPPTPPLDPNRATPTLDSFPVFQCPLPPTTITALSICTSLSQDFYTAMPALTRMYYRWKVNRKELDEEEKMEALVSDAASGDAGLMGEGASEGAKREVGEEEEEEEEEEAGPRTWFVTDGEEPVDKPTPPASAPVPAPQHLAPTPTLSQPSLPARVAEAPIATAPERLPASAGEAAPAAVGSPVSDIAAPTTEVLPPAPPPLHPPAPTRLTAPLDSLPVGPLLAHAFMAPTPVPATAQPVGPLAGTGPAGAGAAAAGDGMGDVTPAPLDEAALVTMLELEAHTTLPQVDVASTLSVYVDRLRFANSRSSVMTEGVYNEYWKYVGPACLPVCVVLFVVDGLVWCGHARTLGCPFFLAIACDRLHSGFAYPAH